MSIQIHHDHGSRLGGIHLEMTGELDQDGYSVTECMGGSMGLKARDLSLNYQVSPTSPFRKCIFLCC